MQGHERNQRVCDDVAKVAQGEARLHELNATFCLQPAATNKAAMMPILLPPTMQQPPGTLLQPVEGVFVGVGTMVGGAPPTRGDRKKSKCRRGKDNVEIVSWRHCKTAHNTGQAWRRLVTSAQGKEC